MKATYMYGAGDVRVIDAAHPVLQEPTDALVRVVRSCVCGSDLHPCHAMPAEPTGSSMGHEFIGIVEAVGVDVTTVRTADFVIAPFAVSCGGASSAQQDYRPPVCEAGSGTTPT